MRNLSELGLVKSSNIDFELISRVEQRIGRKLPFDYCNFVRFADEAQPTINGIEFGGQKTIVDSFFKFSDDEHDGYSIFRYIGTLGMPQYIIPFARDPGDGMFCMDLNLNSAVGCPFHILKSL